MSIPYECGSTYRYRTITTAKANADKIMTAIFVPMRFSFFKVMSFIIKPLIDDFLEKDYDYE